MRAAPPRQRARLGLSSALLGALSLLVLVTTFVRSGRLVATDNVLVLARAGAPAATVAAAPAAERAPEAHMRPVDELAELARLRAELGEFARTAWPARAPGCAGLGAAQLSRLAASVEAGANETFRSAASQPRWLSAQRLAAAADGSGLVIVTWANAHFSDFVENFVVSLQRLGLANFLVGALDDELPKLLGRPGGPVPAGRVFRMLADEALQTGAKEHWGWGSPKFNQMGRHKGVLMRAALALGVTLLLCDVDTVWLRDPRPLLARYGQVDLLITTDVLAPSRTAARRGAPFASADGGLEAALTDVGHVPHAHLLLMRSNIGVMLLRPTLPMRLFIEEYVRVLSASAKGSWDQAIFNDVLRYGFSLASAAMADKYGKRVGAEPWDVPRDLDGVQLPAELPDRSVRLFCGLLHVGVLPAATFANGWAFWVGRLHEALGLSPYVVHNTYQYWGSSGKRMRFREAGLWHVDPPGRFALGDAVVGLGAPWAGVEPAVAGSHALGPREGGGLLRAAAYVPPALLERLDISGLSHAESKLPEHHAALLQAQVAGAASALALARALRRALELPSLWCGCDRTFMVAWNCSYSHALLRRPFRCPTDHAINLGAWDGLRLPYRAPGFWDQRAALPPAARAPEHPAAAPAAGVRVHLCGARASGAPPASGSLAQLAASATGGGARAAALRARCARAEAAAAQPGGSAARAFLAANERGAARALAGGGGAGGGGAAEEAARAALLPRGLSDEEAARALKPYAWASALSLDSTDGLLGRIESAANRKVWAERLAPALGMQWCCTPAGGFRLNFSAASDCSSAERVGLRQLGGMDRILHCEGRGGFGDVQYPTFAAR